jgi:hypothetical protein
MYLFHCHALWILPYLVYKIHDKGVTEVMLFLCIQHAMASTTTILELAEEHRQKYFPG